MLVRWTHLFVWVCVTPGCGACVTECCVECCVVCDMGPHWFAVHMRSPCLGTLHTSSTFVVTHTLSMHCVVGVDVGVSIPSVYTERVVALLCLSPEAGLVTSPLGL